MIGSLIDKSDNFELVRAQIANVIALETASQQAKATAGSKNAALWKLRVYEERANPWEQYPGLAGEDMSPIVNIWTGGVDFDAAASNLIERQRAEGTFNIDCYGCGVSSPVTGGHVPGDYQASITAQRAARLVRNILMSDQYVFLAIPSIVARRWISSIKFFQPQANTGTIENMVACRIDFRVMFNEYAPQLTPEIIEEIGVAIKRSPDGAVLAEAEYIFTN